MHTIVVIVAINVIDMNNIDQMHAQLNKVNVDHAENCVQLLFADATGIGQLILDLSKTFRREAVTLRQISSCRLGLHRAACQAWASQIEHPSGQSISAIFIDWHHLKRLPNGQFYGRLCKQAQLQILSETPRAHTSYLAWQNDLSWGSNRAHLPF